MKDSGTEQLSPRAKALREHREIFEYALAHGLTLKEAEAEISRQRWAAAQARLAQVQACGRVIDDRPAIKAANERSHPLKAIPADAPWMMRD